MIYRHVARYREDTPTDKELLENYKRAAYRDHDTLVGMGGRPTRKVFEEPAGKAVFEKDQIRIFDEHGEPQGTVGPNEDLTVHHWKTECVRFEEELDRWKEFRDYQPGMVGYPLLKCTFNSDGTDQRLVEILVRLNDWREFQYYYQRKKVGEALKWTWQSMRDMRNLLDEEAMPEDLTSSSKIACKLVGCLQEASSRQWRLDTSQKQLAWIESQIPKILTESYASLEADLILHRQLEMKLEQQAKELNQELEKWEARPVRSLQPPPQSTRSSQRIHHWGAETTRLMQEREEWKIFMRWRDNQPSTEDAAITAIQEQSEQLSDLRIWTDYVSYRRYQLYRIQRWLAGLQMLLKYRENKLNTTPRDQLDMLNGAISWLRADVEKVQYDINTAELEVRSAEEQLAKISSKQLSPAPVQMTLQSNGHPQVPSGIPYSRQSSNVSKKRRNMVAKENKSNKEPPDNVQYQVNAGDDIHMMETHDRAGLEEATEHGERARVTQSPRSDAGEVVMMDAEEPIDTYPGVASEVHSKYRSTRISRNSSLPTHQASTLEKTHSAKQLNQTVSGRVLEPAGRKPVRKAKAFTDKQNTALLDPTLAEGSPTIPSLLRKSQRLRDKAAAASLSTSPSPVDATEPSKSSTQKKPRGQLKSVGPSHSPRKEKQKSQPRALEPQKETKQRKSKMPSKIIKPSPSSRPKRLKP